MAGTVDFALPPTFDVPRVCRLFSALLERSGADVARCDVAAVVHPDASAIDVLARLHLIARRRGGDLVVRHASEELRELLGLAGLGSVLRVEPRRQMEE